MNPDPPPIADAQGAPPLPIETAPRTVWTWLLGLVHICFGVPTLLLGFFIPGDLMPRMTLGNTFGYAVVGVFSLVLCALGFLLIRHGLRIWKYGR